LAETISGNNSGTTRSDLLEFEETNAQAFGVAVIFDKKKKIFESQRIKEKESETGTTYYVSVPYYGYLPKLPSAHAKQA
jgi:hypothetical protein